MKMRYEEILEQLKSLSNPEAAAGMERYGISTESAAYGVSIPNLRKMAKEIGRDHSLAQKLWASDIRETRMLAAMIDDPIRKFRKYIQEAPDGSLLMRSGS